MVQIRVWYRTLIAFSCTLFACLYKRGHNFSMPARTHLKQKGLYSIQNSDSFKLHHKAVCVTVFLLRSPYIIFVILKAAKWHHFWRSWDISVIKRSFKKSLVFISLCNNTFRLVVFSKGYPFPVCHTLINYLINYLIINDIRNYFLYTWLCNYYYYISAVWII